MASKFHPRWDALPVYVKMLMGRNSYQILGLDLETPSDFVICWTLDGQITGGTGQTLRMAAYYGIPVLNFGNLTLNEMNTRLEILLEKNP